MATIDSSNVAASATIPTQPSYASVAAKVTLEQLQNFVTPLIEKSAASAAAPTGTEDANPPIQTVTADTRVITQLPRASTNLSVGSIPAFSRFSEEERIMFKTFVSLLPSHNSGGYMAHFNGDVGPKCENCEEFRAAKYATKSFDDGRHMPEELLACIVRNACGSTHLERYHVRASADIRRVFCSLAFSTIMDLESRLNQKLNKSDVETVRSTLLAAMEKQKVDFQAQLDEKTAQLSETTTKTTNLSKSARRQIEMLRKQNIDDNSKIVRYLEQITDLTTRNAELSLGFQNGPISEEAASALRKQVRAEIEGKMKAQLKEKSDNHAKELQAQAEAYAEMQNKLHAELHQRDQINAQNTVTFQTMHAEIMELRAKVAAQQAAQQAAVPQPKLLSTEDAGLEADPATYVAGFCTHVFDSSTGPARCVNPLAYKNPKYCACHVIEMRKMSTN